MVRISLDIFKASFLVALAWAFTKWYLPVNVTVLRYVTTAEATLSILWVFHIGIRLPLGVSSTVGKDFLPPHR